MEETTVFCQVCLSTLKSGDLYCSSCGAVVPDQPPTAKVAEPRGRIAGERKYLTVLCADLQRSTDLISELDPESAISRLEPALIAMRTAVRRNRGIVSKEGGDGLIALFGAPHADDNHAVMACHAAVELVRRVKLLDDPALRVRVGLHSGYVVAHVIEGDLSSIYEAGGPAVHLVKRLESAAQAGQIIVSESCQSLSAGLVTFNALPPKRLEGFSAPVPCHELAEISGLSRWRARSNKGLSSFVGRSEEIAVLEQAAREVSSSGQIVALVGTAGIGKSRMAHEFVGRLRQENWQLLEAEGNPLQQAVPYALLKKLLQSALQPGKPPLADPSELPEGATPTHFDLWPAALCSVLDQPVTDSRWQLLEPLLRRRVISEAVCNTIDRIASTEPTILLLEDLHWTDGQSQTVVEALISTAASRRLLVLLTWRTEDRPGWLERLNARKIWLRSLDGSSANKLLGDLLGTRPNLDGLKAHILRHTGQVPLFIEEVSRQLINRGVLDGDATRFAAKAPWDALEIPPTVQGVIASRIDRLSKEDKSLLQLASVVGPRISPALLMSVTGMPAAHLQTHLWSLEVLDFLVESQWLGSPEYGFAHDLIREVAYNSILRSQREELHRRILTSMEAIYEGREQEVAEALCRHALEARDWAKAAQHGQIAARKALARSGFRDATGYFESAIYAVDKLPDTVERERQAIDLRIEARLAFAPLGSMERWFGLCRDAEARSEKIGDERRRLASIVAKAVALNFYGTPFEGITAAEQALALANDASDKSWLGYAEYVLGQAHFIAGNYRVAKECLDLACARVARAPDSVPPGTTGASLLVLCHMMRAIVHGSLGEFEESVRSLKQAGDLADRNDRIYDVIAAEYGRGLVQMMRGNLDDAKLALDRALSLSRENDVRLFLPLVMIGLGNLYCQQGYVARARDVLLEAKDQAEAVGHATSMVAVSAYLGTAYCHLGEIQRGLEMVRACQASAKQKGYGGIEALAVFAEASVLASQGAPVAPEVIGCVNRAIDIAKRLDARPLLGAAKGLLARVLAASGRKQEAQDELLQAITLFDRSRMTVHLERAKVALSKFSNP
jgi:class 3 adenylate cyclase/tetratricopeptide (TPR) repeat protein